jgi:hypothetical protein
MIGWVMSVRWRIGEIVMSRVVTKATNSPTVVPPPCASASARVTITATPLLATSCVSGVMVAPATIAFIVVRLRVFASSSKRRRSKSPASKVRTTRQPRAMSSTMPIRRTCDSYDWPLIARTRFCTLRTTSASIGMMTSAASVSCQFR